ncbi:MAG: hypothetical protein L0Y79_12890, partial [Chlorobi bacterium]|nr:hypothetical protein [Chlorobiota bacterium]
MKEKKLYKTVLYKLAIILAIPLLYFLILSGFKGTENTNTTPILSVDTRLTPVPNTKSFVNCIFNGGLYYWEGDWIENELSANRYNDLNFNTIHLYDNINGDNNGTDYYGRFENPLDTTQISHVNGLLNLTDNKELEILFERSKISKLCYAQRLVYEAEGGNNGFSYTTRINTPITDSGRTVVKACTTCPPPNSSAPSWLVKDIYENLQHSDLYDFNLQYADSGTWYMKPMMRIPVNTPDDKKIVRIVVNNFQGDTIYSVILRAMNFKVGGSYNGQYTDKYTFQIGDSMQISGSKVNSDGLGYGIEPYWWLEWEANCKIDFKVYWFGEVDVWFDKMTVDDFYANKLFDPNPLVNFDSKIEEEVTNFADHDGLYSFFADECAYSTIPCIKYVKSKMTEYNPNARLHIAVTNYHSILGLKEPSVYAKMFEENPDFYSVNPDMHTVQDLMPYEFINLDTRFADQWKSTSNDDYNNYLQYKAFGDRYAVTDKYSWTFGRYEPTPVGSLVYQLWLTKQQLNQY